MSNRFFKTTFTPAVQDEQRQHGSYAVYTKHLADDGSEYAAILSNSETALIEARDSFYIATVSETGWPYVQHRGGPIGFVRVLDAQSLAWIDFVGNRQYISIGNSARCDRVALIFVDYPNRMRLKILGRLSCLEASERPDLVRDLRVPGYHARPEHIIRIAVEAFDWNCPQHITPRYTLAEIGAGFAKPA